MALAPVLSSSISTLVFLMTAESGLIITGFDYTAQGQREEVFDASVGYPIGFVEFDYELTGSVKGRISGASGVGASVPGAAISLGNSTSVNGITAGGVYCTSVAASHSEKQFREVTVNFTKKPGIA